MTDQSNSAPPTSAHQLTGASRSLSQMLRNKRSLWTVVLILTCAGLSAFATSIYLSPDLMGVAALSVGAIGLWATGLVPEYWTALAFFLVAVIFGVAAPETIFSGFHSSTFWLLFSGLVLGAAIKHTTLDKRAAGILALLPLRSYGGLLTGIVVFSVALAFVMPSSIGRIMILLPVISALAERVGFGAASNGRTGMLAVATFGTFAPAFTILPANAPNMILVGMSETIYGINISYFDYLLLHFPVLGVVKSAVLVGLAMVMFPDRIPTHSIKAAPSAAPFSRQERILSLVLALCLLLWLTDQIHMVSPAWVGMAAALICLLPGADLTRKGCINTDLSYGALLFVAGIMGLGAVISSAGLGEAVVGAITGTVAFAVEWPVWNTSILIGLSTLVAMITNLPGVPAVMTPLAGELSDATGLPLETVLMTQVVAFSNVFLPFQAPPLIAAIQAGNLPAGAVIRLCLSLFLISLLLLAPLDLLWWHLLGMF
ncbi:putative sodium dependent symporter (plasmid) [Phaeobacter inhibens]|uniref:Sodium dependent symporter n=1 Tax=Phaeobacter inhibens TaxID=221822 RepID=A0ABN5GSQ7_9RHOB|nr:MULTISPECIES: SLC13 family permease [Phaeobacter]AUQ52031.1 putative sodium dependent symporter [Phaeobacter inhibens]AUQ96635.1 putative sodium dependent symporter [Phaeobacter inhibens]AUR21836.1 putative sodium dependent symporter [Phaeobacter inhibens]MBQ4806158.1 anion permease [Phaeobacter sp. HS012]MBQ4881008.1 anion permease [Phaeobacter sp. HS011]